MSTSCWRSHALGSFVVVTLTLVVAAQAGVRPTGQVMKRGLAEAARDNYNCLDFAFANSNRIVLSFMYNWGSTPQCAPVPTAGGRDGSIGFVPMLWSGHDINSTVPAGSAALLGFNEPNHREQSNMAPEEAAALWPLVEALAQRQNITLLGSPAAAPCGGGNATCNGGDAVEWFTAFFAACNGTCRTDFIATHYYGCEVAGLVSYLSSLHAAFGKPIWLTEFNCGGASHVQSVARQMEWMKDAMRVLDDTPFVERYSWMSGRDGHLAAARLFEGNASNITLTKLGQQYVTL